MNKEIVPQLEAGAPSPAKKRRPLVAKVRPLHGSVYQIAEAPEGYDGWMQELQRALGASSPIFVKAALRQLIAACELPGERAGTISVSSALQLIASLEPENEMQGAFAVHIACLHMATINLMSRMQHATQRNTLAMASALTKLEGAFERSVDAYQRLKRGVHQVVRIERVVINNGAEAVIGVVTTKPTHSDP